MKMKTARDLLTKWAIVSFLFVFLSFLYRSSRSFLPPMFVKFVENNLQKENVFWQTSKTLTVYMRVWGQHIVSGGGGTPHMKGVGMPAGYFEFKS